MSTWMRVIRAIEPHPSEHFKDKAIAVALAFMLWTVINAEEPQIGFYPAVPVQLVNQPANLAIAEDWQDTLEIRVSGSQRDLSSVSPGSLSPRIDLARAGAGENIFPLLADDFAVPSGVQVTSWDPQQIRIVLEARTEKPVNVSPVLEGDPAPGYEVVGRTTDPETVVVSGPATLIASLDRVITTNVDVSGRRESFTQRATLVPGSPLVELRGSHTVQLTIEIQELPIDRQFDDVAIEVTNARYRVDINPQRLSIVLSGPPSALEQIEVANLRLVIDAGELEPRNADYKIQPSVAYGDGGLDDSIRVSIWYPQREINVHVYNQPPRQ